MGAFLWFCPSGQCYPRDQNNHMAAPVKVAKQQTTPELSGTLGLDGFWSQETSSRPMTWPPIQTQLEVRAHGQDTKPTPTGGTCPATHISPSLLLSFPAKGRRLAPSTRSCCHPPPPANGVTSMLTARLAW